jgi:arsenite methyltransferase
MEHGSVIQKGVQKKAFYGMDVPAMVRDCVTVGVILAIQGVLLRWWAKKGQYSSMPLFLLLSGAMVVTGGISIVEGLSVVWDSLVAKLWERDRLLDGLQLRGNEHVLDVGCGHGLLLVGAAKRLPHGRAVGIDLWSQVDQGSNTKKATLQNARIEGVEDRVEIHDGDMRTMPFPDASFDVVVASLAIHNVESSEARAQVTREIRRVLKPGGRIAIIDIFFVQEMAEYFRKAGMHDVQVSQRRIIYWPPMRTITGIK